MHANNKGNFEFVADDFYKFAIPEGGYDLVYDYTYVLSIASYHKSNVYFP